MPTTSFQLISYIAPSAPATRRPAEGNEPFLRPEFGFTPKWYREKLGIDFGKRWHTNPAYRRECVIDMREELRRGFPGTTVGRIDRPDVRLDLLTGAYGTCLVAGIYGIPIVYAEDKWPDSAQDYITDDEADRLKPPDLDTSPLFRDLMRQVNWIGEKERRIEGFINWQGVLNNAYRLRGENLFRDMVDKPERCRRLFDCICTTMVEGAKKLYERQRASGVEVNFLTVSNCLVNMVSPEQYRHFLLPLDCRIAETFGCVGIHNCAWKADPYIADYATLPHVAYIDMGLTSDLPLAREAFPNTMRGLMYTPTDLAAKPLAELQDDLEKIARDYAPSDVIAADIDAHTPDQRVRFFLDMCDAINRTR